MVSKERCFSKRVSRRSEDRPLPCNPQPEGWGIAAREGDQDWRLDYLLGEGLPTWMWAPVATPGIAFRNAI